MRLVTTLLFALVTALGLSSPASAQIQRNFINLSFEEPNIPGSPCRVYITDTQVPGWTTSHPVGNIEAVDNCGGIILTPATGRLIELWNGPRQGIAAREGTQFAELNAVVASRISQNVCLLPNEEIEWHFSHRGRTSATVGDQMEFLIGSQQIVRVATTNDGDGRIVNTTLGSSALGAGGGGWVDYGGTFIYSGVGGQTNIGFGALSSAGGSPTEGNFIDRIDVILKPFVDFAAGSFSSLEGSGTDLPAIRIVGTVPAGGMNVRVVVTGGTATLGADYSTPANAAAFNIFVPAGDYGSGGSVTLPVQALLDAITPEPDETVILQLQPVTAADDYVINSTRVCPGTPIIQTTWTIRDAAPSLALTKTATVIDAAPAGPSPGDIIRYSFAVTNTGNQPLTNVTVSDTLPGIVFATPPRSIPALAVGATNSTTFANYATYTVTAADIAAGSVTNTATATGTAGITPITSNPSSVTMPLTQSPGLSLLKTAVYDDGNRGYAQVGDPIAYTFRVTNTGNVPVSNISISDSMLPPSLRPIVCPTVNPGTSATCTNNNTSPITYSITQANIEAGQVANTATASGATAAGAITSNPSSTNTPLVQAARLALTKTAASPSTQAPGGTIAYTLRVTNTGNVPVNTLSIVDPQLLGAATCPPGILAVGATVTCTGSHTITQAEMDAGQSVNTAQARGLTPTGVAVVSPPASTTTRLTTVRSISVDKRVIRSTISAPTTLVYAIVVTNTGTASFNTLTGTDLYPDGSTGAIANLISQTGGDTDTVFEPGEVWTYEVSFVVTQAQIDAGTTRVNRATFSAQVAAETPVTATDTASTAIIQQPSLAVTKIGSPSNVTSAGTTINYIMTVRNTGNVPLSATSATDQLTQAGTPLTLTTFTGPSGDGGTLGTLDIGETWLYGAQYAVTQVNIDLDQDLLNSFTFTATSPSGATLTRTATAPTFINPAARMTVTKSVDKSAISSGDTLNYTVVLTNAGNATLTSVVLNDVLPDGTTLVPPTPASNLPAPAGTDGDLDVGEVWTYTFPFVVSDTLFQQRLAQALPANQDLVNTVTPSATGPAGPVNAPSASAVTHPVARPEFHIEKIVDRGSISAPSTLNYTITVENVGNQNLTVASITDQLTGGDRAGPTPLTLSAPTESITANGIIDLGEIWTYTASYPATQDDINTQTNLVNTVTLAVNQIATPASASATTTVIGDPHLQVSKSVNFETVDAAPTTLTYTIIVRNTGNLELTGITVTDQMTGGSHPPGSPQTITPVFVSATDADGDGRIDVGDSWTYTATYTVTQDDINSAALLNTNLLLNTVTADSNETGPATDAAVTTILSTPSLTLRKSVDIGTTPASGPLNYTITLTNTGNTELTGVATSDILTSGTNPSGMPLTLSGPTESLVTNDVVELGETWTYTAIYNVPQSDIDFAQDIVNAVTVTTDETPPQTSEATTYVTATARMRSLKYPDRSPIAEPGVVNFSIAVYNAGTETLTNVDLQDVLPDGTPLTTIPAPASNFTTDSDPTNDGLAGLPDLDVGEYFIYAIPFTVTPELFQCAMLPQSACGLPSHSGQIVNATTPIAAEVPTPTTQDVSAPRALGIVSVLAQPEMALEKRVDRVAIGGAARLTYTIEVSNTGNQNLTGIALSDSLSGGALPAATPLTLSGPTGDAGTAGTLDVGETWTYSASYDATALDVASGNDLVNTVTATSTEAPTTLSATATTDMVAAPALDIEKTVDRTIIGAPGPLTYTIAVTNIGNIPQTGIALTDMLDDRIDLTGAITGPSNDTGTIGALDLGETWTYMLTYDVAQADIEAGPELINIASVTSNQVPVPETASVTTFVVYFLGIDISKSGRIVDNGDGFSGPGDTIEYSFLITNTGNVTLNDVTARDPGPSFNGTSGAGTMSAITPAPTPLGPGESRTFTATYTPTQEDYDNAASLGDAVVNTADAVGFHTSGIVISTPSTVALTLAGQAGDIAFVKQALVETIVRGAVAPFAIIIENRGNIDLGPSIVTDIMPPGFIYVENSATINGAPAAVTVEGRRITFTGITVPPGGRLAIGLSLRALPGTPPGTYVNGATIVDALGEPDAPAAEAEITIVPEAVFDCSEVLGKVFNDIDRDGYQDEGEPGLPGVRLATVRGTLITTDEFGRYSIPCAALPNQEIGSNFVLKLDARTLPTGFALTTDNPAMIRLTAGKMSEINFGASIGRQVRIDLDAAAFVSGSAEPGGDLVAALDQLIPVLLPERASLTLTYTAEGGDTLGTLRLQRLETLIRARWADARAPYDLVVDLRVMGGGP